MKLEVGMYAFAKGKSRDYGIGKIVNIHSNGFAEHQVEIQFKHSKHSVCYSSVVSSHNIIDLIELGDYVNGYPVIEIDLENDEVAIDKIDDVQDWGATYIESDFIENVVTKEQFESVSYKVSGVNE